jgi:hypothetical protein
MTIEWAQLQADTHQPLDEHTVRESGDVQWLILDAHFPTFPQASKPQQPTPTSMRPHFQVTSSFAGSMIVKSIVCVFAFFSMTTTQFAQAMFKVHSIQSMFLSSWKYKTGDSVTWSMPTYDDSHWRQTDVCSLPIDERGVFWLRKSIRAEIISAINLEYDKYAASGSQQNRARCTR